MIDLHTHILPGIDDGSKCIDDSLAMLKMAERIGFQAIVLTPHYMTYTNYTSPLVKNREIMLKLQRAMKDAGIAIKIYLGNEVFYDPDILDQLDRGQFVTLNKSNYMLVETVRHDADVGHFEDFLYRLQIKGYSPIIAHPERYDFVQENPDVLMRFLEMGSLVQMNALSLTGYYGHHAIDTARIMLERNMVQFMASDAHKLRAYKQMDKALDEAWEILGEKRFNTIMRENPIRVLGNVNYIDVNPKKEKTMKKKSFLSRIIDK